MFMYGKEKIARVFLPRSQKASESLQPSNFTSERSLESGNTMIKSDVQAHVPCHEEPESGTMKSLEIRTISQEMSASLGIECPLPSKTILTSTCDHNGGVITIKDGLKISIPKNAIRVGDIITFYVALSLYGPFILPLEHLASPYYWIGVSGSSTESYHFQRPIEVEFEQYRACNNPSHYQLLCCEDNDKTYTVQPVNKVLEFTVQDDKSLCRFQTNHFCSYCLSNSSEDDKCKNCSTYRIAVLYLKPRNDKPLGGDYKVQIWFIYDVNKCLIRATELYETEDMEVFSSKHIEACCDKNSTDFFSLEYDRTVNDWHIDHTLTTEIKTKEVNFYNKYEKAEHLQASEENKLFPPRFILHIRHSKCCNTYLDTNIYIYLCNNREDKKLELLKFKIFRECPTMVVSRCPTNIHDVSKCSSSESDYDIIEPKHSCAKNKPKLKELLKYVERYASRWKLIAVQLNIPAGRIAIIQQNNTSDVEESCLNMFTFWLENQKFPCWCKFIKALCTVGLHDVAHIVNEHFKQLCKNKDKSDIQNDHEILPYKLEPLKRIPDMCDNNKRDDDPFLKQLARVFKVIPEYSWHDIVTCLFEDGGADVIKDISHSSDRKEKIKKICEAFLKENNPSWSKVIRALKEADCKEAEIIEMFILSPLEQPY